MTVLGLFGLPGYRRAEKEAVQFCRYCLDKVGLFASHGNGKIGSPQDCLERRQFDLLDGSLGRSREGWWFFRLFLRTASSSCRSFCSRGSIGINQRLCVVAAWGWMCQRESNRLECLAQSHVVGENLLVAERSTCCVKEQGERGFFVHIQS